MVGIASSSCCPEMKGEQNTTPGVDTIDSKHPNCINSGQIDGGNPRAVLRKWLRYTIRPSFNLSFSRKAARMERRLRLQFFIVPMIFVWIRREDLRAASSSEQLCAAG